MTDYTNLAMNAHDIADVQAMNSPGIIEAVVALAKETVKSGHWVIIRNNHDQLPVKTIKSMDELLIWISELRGS